MRKSRTLFWFILFLTETPDVFGKNFENISIGFLFET